MDIHSSIDIIMRIDTNIFSIGSSITIDVDIHIRSSTGVTCNFSIGFTLTVVQALVVVVIFIWVFIQIFVPAFVSVWMLASMAFKI